MAASEAQTIALLAQVNELNKTLTYTPDGEVPAAQLTLATADGKTIGGGSLSKQTLRVLTDMIAETVRVEAEMRDCLVPEDEVS